MSSPGNLSFLHEGCRFVLAGRNREHPPLPRDPTMDSFSSISLMHQKEQAAYPYSHLLIMDKSFSIQTSAEGFRVQHFSLPSKSNEVFREGLLSSTLFTKRVSFLLIRFVLGGECLRFTSGAWPVAPSAHVHFLRAGNAPHISLAEGCEQRAGIFPLKFPSAGSLFFQVVVAREVLTLHRPLRRPRV
jgi:hypothetical protein